MPPQNQTDIERVASNLLSGKNLRLISCKSIQSLWAGYGHICQIKAVSVEQDPSENSAPTKKPRSYSLILKYISPPPTNFKKSHQDEGHIRKLLSYQIEQYFYTHLAPQMPKDIAVASCIASIDPNTTSLISDSSTTNPTTAMIMTDLREQFPFAGEKRSELSEPQALAALRWLANFHGFWWTRTTNIQNETCVLPPLEHFKQYQSTTLPQEGNVWLNGGYTYLETRRTEYDSLRFDQDSEWSSVFCDSATQSGLSVAALVSKVLAPPSTTLSSTTSSATTSSANSGTSTPSQPLKQSLVDPYITLLHGDVKSENLFTTAGTASQVQVAFYDFQYTGLGLGVSDLAKLFTCSIPLSTLVHSASEIDCDVLPMSQGEERLLRTYLTALGKWSGKRYEWDLFTRHWECALVDWCRFQASWGFWGNTEWLEARVRWIVQSNGWRAWIGSVMGEMFVERQD